ncbi:MAG: acyl-CoA dehydrogenase [Gammaproteobacteria bacterium]
MSVPVFVLVLLIITLALAWFRARLGVQIGVYFGFLGLAESIGPGIWNWVWILFAVVSVVLLVRPLRRALMSKPLLGWFRTVLPPLSPTEQIALNAGNTWWDADLFSGRPDWSKLLANPAPQLSPEEQAFLDGPVEEFCRSLDDWRITDELNDLPPESWALIRKHKLFGMIIPKEYGGLEFSALGNSSVVMKIASRSLSAGVTVMVPNSLGPGELLMHYGTDAQKRHYLPRLATGEEIPCFALTSPWAGSDAGALPDVGIICKGMHEGREVLGMRVTWDKRYITLAPVATVLGLAFKAYDPDQLLGDTEDLGITCALIPTDTPGVEIGQRHAPLNASFMNGPTRGKDVFIPMDWLIGGTEYIGKGWMMLMNCLSAGRAISLPALGTSSGKMASRMTGAYARVRRQFRVPIGAFEGVEEALTRIAGYTYRMDAARVMTAGAIDLGNKPSVLSAILKYHNTEGMRQVVGDAMDVHGGRGVIMGPANYLARNYQAVPISITVEGANILTRSMIIFGQGAIRCHPYLLREVEAASNPDRDQGVRDFDDALFAHIGHVISNKVRAFVGGLTGARLFSRPTGRRTGYYFRQLSRMSAAFAFLADVTLALLGGELKRREKLSARFGDVLSHLYLSSAALKRFEDQGRPSEDRPLLDWALRDSLFKMQLAIEDILRNFPVRWLGVALRLVVFPLGRPYAPPSDRLGHAVARLLLEPSLARDRLTAGVYLPDDAGDPVGLMDAALVAVIAAEPIERKLEKGLKVRLHPATMEPEIERGLGAGVIDADEAAVLREALALTTRAIAVDEFGETGRIPV